MLLFIYIMLGLVCVPITLRFSGKKSNEKAEGVDRVYI
jgi:hypothetical protein